MEARRPVGLSPLVEILDVSVRLDDRWVLAHLDVRVESGDALWLTGANGAGKSTLLRLMAGSISPQRGRLRLFGGLGPPWPPTLRRQLGLMGHAHGHYEAFSGAENLRWAAELTGAGQAAAQAMAAVHLRQVGLEAAGALPVGRFSAGMQRRLALARLLLRRPQLMLVDEPFVQLDDDGVGRVLETLTAHLQAGGTLVFSSHDASAARRLATRRLHLEGGFADIRPVQEPLR